MRFALLLPLLLLLLLLLLLQPIYKKTVGKNAMIYVSVAAKIESEHYARELASQQICVLRLPLANLIILW